MCRIARRPIALICWLIRDSLLHEETLRFSLVLYSGTNKRCFLSCQYSTGKGRHSWPAHCWISWFYHWSTYCFRHFTECVLPMSLKKFGLMGDQQSSAAYLQSKVVKRIEFRFANFQGYCHFEPSNQKEYLQCLKTITYRMLELEKVLW